MNNTQIYGIIGDGIDYSLSPAIYRELFARKRVNAVYNIFNIKAESLEQFVSAARLLDLSGFNVTIPHKRRVLQYVDKIDRLAALTQSANLVVNRKGLLHAYNTDLQGVKQSIEQGLKYDVKGCDVVMIGSGGAAQTVYYYLVGRRPKRITVHHRSPERLLRFGVYARGLPRFAQYRGALIDSTADLPGDCDLCINCTPAPLTDLLAEDAIDRMRRIFELRYGDYPLLKRKHLRGNLMLAVQAAATFQIMTGIVVSSTSIMRTIEESLAHD
jgi:shikimate dehydrogenase